MARTTRFNKRRAYKKRKATRKYRKSRKQYGGTCELQEISKLISDAKLKEISAVTLSKTVSKLFSRNYDSIHLYSNNQSTPIFSGEIVNVEYDNNLPVINVLILQGQKCTNDKRQLTINSENKIQIGSEVSKATHYRIHKLTKLGSDCTANCIQ